MYASTNTQSHKEKNQHAAICSKNLNFTKSFTLGLDLFANVGAARVIIIDGTKIRLFDTFQSKSKLLPFYIIFVKKLLTKGGFNMVRDTGFLQRLKPFRSYRLCKVVALRDSLMSSIYRVDFLGHAM